MERYRSTKPKRKLNAGSTPASDAKNGSVAQWIEHSATNGAVGGSSPSRPAIRPYSEKDITIVFETISTGSIPVGDARGAEKRRFYL